MTQPHNNIPTVLVALGGTGDLMKRKVIPALYHLYQHKELPDKFRIIGFSRRDMNDASFQEYVAEVLQPYAGAADIEPFLKFFRFHQGTFEDKDSYRALQKRVEAYDKEWGVCTNKFFYLAVAPEFYEGIFKQLSGSGLTDPCSPAEGWTRLIVEKPIGVDTKTAKSIEKLLARLFKSEQIYRIDHYLAKEMLQNILTFRFSNNLFEMQWGKALIEKIEIRALEEIGVEKRGAFYDPVGAFRDVGQNHFLQMLALLTMEHPRSFDAKAVHKCRAEILKKLHIFKPDEVRKHAFRAQYDGYRSIPGVKPDSDTETYFKVRAALDTPRWKGVPIYLEGGKRLGAPVKEIVVTFKHPKPCLCPTNGPLVPRSLGEGGHHKNAVIIRFEPKEEILIEFWSKKPGFTFDTAPHMFHFLFREPQAHVPYIEEYAKLLLDCIRGDQTLFVSSEEVKAMWRFTDPILDVWHKKIAPLYVYQPDLKEIVAQALKAIQ